MQTTPRVIILVLNWNGWHDTLDCLASLYAGSYRDFQVVLIDNASEDASLQRIREWAERGAAPAPPPGHAAASAPLPYLEYDRTTAEAGGIPEREARLAGELPTGVSHPLVIIQSGGNLGFAGGNNVGLRYAGRRGAEYVLLLNNDASMRSAEALGHLVRFLELTPRAGACGARLFYPDGAPQICYGNFPAPGRALAYLFPVYKLLPGVLFRTARRSNVVPDASCTEPLAVDYPSGACLLVRSRAIAQVGLLDERFFMYAEETDWCLRLRRQGWDSYYVPQSEVVHKGGGSSGTSGEPLNRRFTESLFKYYAKHFSPGAFRLVAAGYLVRSLYGIAHWSLRARLVSSSERGLMRARARYWRACLELAAGALLAPSGAGTGGSEALLPGREPS
ncbi:rhamnosyltransferase [Geomonas silvestris]|uniref:Rhamnosyltransferase n=1 Tax=Geomonas silvestris TaxID=2740184 RepID=A0A6V8MJ08_9BACT|nr:glycosyltransferase family 2 protein [Geomonas silvestris]GFO59669.1 rhamnosyltransferase [Geomonas silvestris]